MENAVKLRLRPFIAVAVPLTVVAAALAAPAVAQATTLSTFTVYDNSAYSSATIGHGSVASNLLPNAVCASATSSGTTMPSEATWKSDVDSADVNGSAPLVLDCENLYLNGSSPQPLATVESDLSQLQSWARQEATSLGFTGQIIGWYGLANTTPSANYSYYQDLLAQDSNTAFFPSAYTFSSSEETWDSTLQASVTNAKAISSSTPIFPYVWPQYHAGSSPSSISLTWIPKAQWSVELAQIAESGLNGLVVWGGSTISGTCDSTCESGAGSQDWLPATQSFLDSLADPQTDIALGTTATVSSVNVAGRGGPQAVDGDPMTRWGSQYSDPQWIELNLGAEYNISGVRLMWETAYGSSYVIQVSNDGSTWSPVYSTTSGAGGVETITGLSATGQYIRMYGTARGTSYGYSLWDFNVYGVAA